MVGATFDSEKTKRALLGEDLVVAAADGLGSEGQAYRAFQVRYHDDPVGFARDCIDWPEGEGLAPYQVEIIAAVPERRRVAVRSPHGAGKSTIAALLGLWYALTRDGQDWKVVTTASAWRQLSKFLWPEVHKWAGRLRWDVVGRKRFSEKFELFQFSLRLETGEAFAAVSDQPELIEGAHADRLLYVFDEAKAIPVATWDAAEGALAGPGETFALAISTPGEPVGRFAEIHHRREGLEDWSTRHVTVDEAIAAGRINADWVDQRRRQWGEDSAVYQNRVLGQFCTADQDGVIPLAWVEAAVERWHEWAERGERGDLTTVGVDVARSGRDQTVFAPRFGDFIGELERHSYADTMQTVGRLVRVLEKHTGARASVDVIGIGAGVVDRLREQGIKVDAFNASESSGATDRSGELRFLNRRAAAWWRVRDLLDPSNNPTIGLPPDDRLIGDLIAPRWRINSTGKIQVEAKDEIRKRIGRSTDCGDAVVQALEFQAAPASKFGYQSIATRRRMWSHPRVWGGGGGRSQFVKCEEDATAEAMLGPAAWRHYVLHHRDQARRGVPKKEGNDDE